MAWGNEFDKAVADAFDEHVEVFNKMFPLPANVVNIADLASGIMHTRVYVDNNEIKVERIEIEKVYSNKVPTHDPYSNPDAHIYYQCNCGAVLDPGTKSFAALNNAAMNSGWKVRFGAEYYIPYCAECGKGIE